MREYTQRWYTQRWEEIYGNREEGWQRTTKQMMSKDREWLYINAEEPVLDVGCGSCIDALFFDEYIGCDITHSFLKGCKKYGVTNVVRCDARKLPFKDKAFESAYAKDVLLHWPIEEGMKIMRELIRVAKTAYVAWGTAFKDFSGGVYETPLIFVPSPEPISFKHQGFYYCRYDIRQLEKHFKIGAIKEGTTITQIEVK